MIADQMPIASDEDKFGVPHGAMKVKQLSDSRPQTEDLRLSTAPWRERVKDRDASGLEIRDIARHHRKPMFERSRGNSRSS
jgi:hypothetical protein